MNTQWPVSRGHPPPPQRLHPGGVTYGINKDNIAKRLKPLRQTGRAAFNLCKAPPKRGSAPHTLHRALTANTKNAS